MKGKLVIISAPSGCGKTTVCGRLTQLPNVRKSISVTTRAPRAYEKDGVHYDFISRDEFYKELTRESLQNMPNIVETFMARLSIPFQRHWKMD